MKKELSKFTERLLKYIFYPMICISISVVISFIVTSKVYPEEDVDVAEQIVFFAAWCTFMTILIYAGFLKIHELITDKKKKS